MTASIGIIVFKNVFFGVGRGGRGVGVGGIRITILGKLVKTNFCPILLKFTLKTVETADKYFSPGGLLHDLLSIARSHAEVI